ncbi:MAG TPA: phage tail protein [Streptosporangiaceae bacterium]|nr:phage tail protein [Streptosporangiaceae bacterium]
MSDLFPVNPQRFDPYKSYAFLVYLGVSTTPAAAVSSVGPVRRYADVVEYRSGGDAIVRKGPGRTHYEPVTLSRGVTQNAEFEDWANAAQVLTGGSPSTSLANLRKSMSIVLLNEDREPVRRYLFYRCWVSEYQALPFLDAGEATTAFEYIKVETEGWERDTSLTEPVET